jgi:hypothetical protein
MTRIQLLAASAKTSEPSLSEQRPQGWFKRLASAVPSFAPHSPLLDPASVLRVKSCGSMMRMQWLPESAMTIEPSRERQRPSQAVMRARSSGPSRSRGPVGRLGGTRVPTVDQSPCITRSPPLLSAMMRLQPHRLGTRLCHSVVSAAEEFEREIAGSERGALHGMPALSLSLSLSLSRLLLPSVVG